MKINIREWISNGWSKLGVFAGLALGVALISGANGFALVYVPTKFLAVPVASAGTLIGTFICARALLARRKQEIDSEVKDGVEARLDRERLVRERDDALRDNARLIKENHDLMSQGMNHIKIKPELKLAFLSMDYEKCSFHEEVIEKSSGERGVFSDDDPKEVKYQGVYCIKGTLEYEIDLASLKVAREGNTIIFCGDISPKAKPLMPTEEKYLLKQEVTRVWDYDEEKEDHRGEEKEAKKAIRDVLDRSMECDDVQKEHVSKVKASLTKSEADYVKNFRKLAEQYLENIFKMTGLEVRFDPKRDSPQTLPEFIAEWNKDSEKSVLRIRDNGGSAFV